MYREAARSPLRSGRRPADEASEPADRKREGHATVGTVKTKSLRTKRKIVGPCFRRTAGPERVRAPAHPTRMRPLAIVLAAVACGGKTVGEYRAPDGAVECPPGEFACAMGCFGPPSCKCLPLSQGCPVVSDAMKMRPRVDVVPDTGRDDREDVAGAHAAFVQPGEQPLSCGYAEVRIVGRTISLSTTSNAARASPTCTRSWRRARRAASIPSSILPTSSRACRTTRRATSTSCCPEPGPLRVTTTELRRLRSAERDAQVRAQTNPE